MDAAAEQRRREREEEAYARSEALRADEEEWAKLEERRLEESVGRATALAQEFLALAQTPNARMSRNEEARSLEVMAKLSVLCLHGTPLAPHDLERAADQAALAFSA